MSLDYEDRSKTDALSDMQDQQVPFFETDLHIPVYRDGVWDKWEIRHAQACLDHGYHSGLWLVANLPVLYKRSDDGQTQPETWMSPSAYEIESQELGCRHAHGYTVVAGLGMSWSAINAALRPQTERVTILEIDPIVITLCEELKIIENAPEEARQKIEVVRADALQWRPESKVDFLYVDIWAKHALSYALDDVKKMQSNIQAEIIYFWGQEIEIFNQTGLHAEHFELTSNQVRRTVEDRIGLPLLIPTSIDYAKMITDVIRNRLRRRLPLRRHA